MIQPKTVEKVRVEEREKFTNQMKDKEEIKILNKRVDESKKKELINKARELELKDKEIPLRI
jgi:hypothetical protein